MCLSLFSTVLLSRIRRQRTKLRIATLILVLCVVIFTYHFRNDVYYAGYRAFHIVSYGTRPLWDKPEREFQRLPLLIHPKMNLSSENLCARYGWKPRSHPVVIFDAVIFSVELDLLELRIRELFDTVDKFLVIEADTTFTGKEKPLVLRDHLQSETNRFKFASSKLVSDVYHDSVDTDEPFRRENDLRQAMNSMLEKQGIRNGDVVIMSDVDEIPKSEVVQLYRLCEAMPNIIHLEMKHYIYSFEFLLPLDPSNRPSIQIYKPGETWYGHSYQSDLLLADAGWHCSFCFPKVSDVQFKMTAYSHAERALRHSALLEVENIQDKICEGKDVYNFLPEAFTFSSLFIQMMSGSHKVQSTWNLPRWAVEHPEVYYWMLPGANCSRPV